MGQRLQLDSIGRLTRLSGTQVSLAASVITVGGQQYVSSSPIILDSTTVGVNGLDTGAVAANQVWYVHAIVNSGALALVASLSKTSPTGYTRFKWTGWVFYVDPSVTIHSVLSSESELILQSASSSNFSDVTGPPVDVTNLEIPIVSKGQKVEISLLPDGTGNLGAYGVGTTGGFTVGQLYILRNGVVISNTEIRAYISGVGSYFVPPSAFKHVDVAPPAGVNTYKVQIGFTVGTSIAMNYAVLALASRFGEAL